MQPFLKLIKMAFRRCPLSLVIVGVFVVPIASARMYRV
jgi:hypothetical protein